MKVNPDYFIRLISDIQVDDVMADHVGAIRVADFQVTVQRYFGGKGIEVSVFRNGLPFHVKSISVNDSDEVVMRFVEGE